MGGVVNIFVGQIKGDDLAVAGVNANVRLAPGAALCRAMLFKQPFAGAAQFQTSAIDNQMKLVRSNPQPVCKQAIHTPAGSASYDREPAGRSPAFS